MRSLLLSSAALLFLCILSCNLFEDENNSVPRFDIVGHIDDTIFVGTPRSDTLLVLDDDEVTLLLSDSTLPFTLNSSILTFDPALSDTGVYEFYLIASDPLGQTDTLSVKVTVLPEYLTFNKVCREVYRTPGGEIECGSTTIGGGDADSTFHESEFNEFGHTTMSCVVSSTYQSTTFYEYKYDSLYFPSVTTMKDENKVIIGYWHLSYDARHNVTTYIRTDADGEGVPDTLLCTYDDNDNMLTYAYSYISTKWEDGQVVEVPVSSLMTFTYDVQNNMTKYVRYDNGIAEDSTLYSYSSNGSLVEKKEYRNEFMYRTTYQNSSSGDRMSEISYHGTGEIADKKEYTYNSAGKPWVIDEFCWNETHYNSTRSTENTWQQISVIKTPASLRMKDDAGMFIRSSSVRARTVSAIAIVKTQLQKDGIVCPNLY